MSQVRRCSAALLILVVVGCGRTGMNSLSHATTDATIGTDSWLRDTGGLVDTGVLASDSRDAGAAGLCGSGISFQIAAAPGVDPDSFCTAGCSVVAKTTFTFGSTQISADDISEPNCVALCEQCDVTPICHSCIGIGLLPAAGFKFSWDGSYRTSAGTCGGRPCRGPRLCAPAGRYTGEFCILRGSVSGGRCFPSQDTSCSTVEFDVPSTATIAVEIGP